MTRLDLANHGLRCENAAVPFNSGTRFGDRNHVGGQPPSSGFIFVSHAPLVRLLLWRAVVGIPARVCRCLRAGSPTPPCARLLRLATRDGLHAHVGGHHA